MGTKTGTFFTVYYVFCESKYMWMLTFHVVLGCQGLLFWDFLWFFFFSFFFSIQLTNPISGNASNAKWKKRGMALRKKIFNWLHFFFTWLFLYHKEVTRIFSSTSNTAWQFSYQWNRQHAILPETQIHMYANLVEQNLILAPSWSLCLYFFKSCFLLDAVSEKYGYISLVTLL